ncbi:MAG: helix-turn-helix transcriptional regulator [Oscillatoria sp. PMC 1068.18]|nr:helix-turn-helix transcriptional regulator [Oscillatoria sp. PMC 1076.18]MEC4989432.1 helix-turn-helix transcriptional regulator [Oscillatoria sp. PMC 1068.18]
MKYLNQALGKILAKYRTKLELSQEELADRAGIHRTYVSQIERGLKSPTLSVLFDISKALDLPASRIIDEIEKEINDLSD